MKRLPICEIVFQPEIEVLTNLADERLPEPFILFSGISDEELDIALDICKGNTRAVLTAANSRMTPYDFSKHLLEEKGSFKKR